MNLSKLTALLLSVPPLLVGALSGGPGNFIVDPSKSNETWELTLDPLRNITSPGAQIDPSDSRVTISGFVTVAVDDTGYTLQSSHSSGSSVDQLVSVASVSTEGWGSVAQTVYFRAQNYGEYSSPRTGLNLVGPSNYCVTGGSGDDKCNAGAYFMYGNHESGEICINKRYVWPSSLAAPICVDVFGSNGMPLNKLIGFRLVTFLRGDGHMRLVVYVNLPNDGVGFLKVLEYLDAPGKWNSTNGVSSECQDKITDGQIFFGGSCVAIHNIGDAVMPLEDSNSLKTIFEPVLAGPTNPPTSMPSAQPSFQFPSSEPSSEPSSVPSLEPSAMPSSSPSSMPSEDPMSESTSKPSSMPSEELSSFPSSESSSVPSLVPSLTPSSETGAPSLIPIGAQTTNSPSVEEGSTPPSYAPSVKDTEHTEPSVEPTITLSTPSSQATQEPSNVLSSSEPSPSASPTPSASEAPTNDDTFVVSPYFISDPIMSHSFDSTVSYVRLDYVIGGAPYEVSVLGPSCEENDRVDSFFHVTDQMSERSDGAFDLSIILNIIMDTFSNQMLYNGTDVEQVMFQGCVRIDTFHDAPSGLILVYYRKHSFSVKVDTTGTIIDEVSVEGENPGSLEDEGKYGDNGVNAFLCDESGTEVTDLVLSPDSHFYCLKPSDNLARINNILRFSIEKAGYNPYAPINDGASNADDVVPILMPDDRTWQIEFYIPGNYFSTGGDFTLSGQVSFALNVDGSDSSNQPSSRNLLASETSAWFESVMALEKIETGLIQLDYFATITVEDEKALLNGEDVAVVTVLDLAINSILPEGLLAKTVSFGSKKLSRSHQSSLPSDVVAVDTMVVEVTFHIYQRVLCSDATCTRAQLLSTEAREEALGRISAGIATAIEDAAKTYDIGGFEALKVTSDLETIVVTEPDIEVFESRTQSVNGDAASIKAIISISGVLAAATLSVVGILVMRRFLSKPQESNHSDDIFSDSDILV